MDTRALLDWVEKGWLPQQHLLRALELAGARPDAARTVGFLDRLLLLAAVFCACSGVIFFFAHNWDAMGRLHKLALAQVVLVLPLLALLRYPLQHWIAQGCLCASGVLLRALLALTGQIYQSGADSFELFMLWGLLLVPWAILARSHALGALIVLLLNLALVLACFTFTQWSPDRCFALLLGMNVLFWLPLACAAWRWPERKVWQLGNGFLVVWLLSLATLWQLLVLHDGWDTLHPWLGIVVWLVLLALLGVLYAWRSFQRPLLALVLMSVTVAVLGWVEYWLGDSHETVRMLILGGATLVLMLLGVAWLKPGRQAHD